MHRRRFQQLVAEALDSLPARFRRKLENIVVLIEDAPRPRTPPHRHRPPTGRLILGVFQGVPRTRKSVFDPLAAPDRITLYQKNIEAICTTDDEIRYQVRLTVLHELGHYFGLSEDELRHL